MLVLKSIHDSKRSPDFEFGFDYSTKRIEYQLNIFSMATRETCPFIIRTCDKTIVYQISLSDMAAWETCLLSQRPSHCVIKTSLGAWYHIINACVVSVLESFRPDIRIWVALVVGSFRPNHTCMLIYSHEGLVHALLTSMSGLWN